MRVMGAYDGDRVRSADLHRATGRADPEARRPPAHLPRAAGPCRVLPGLRRPRPARRTRPRQAGWLPPCSFRGLVQGEPYTAPAENCLGRAAAEGLWCRRSALSLRGPAARVDVPHRPRRRSPDPRSPRGIGTTTTGRAGPAASRADSGVRLSRALEQSRHRDDEEGVLVRVWSVLTPPQTPFARYILPRTRAAWLCRPSRHAPHELEVSVSLHSARST